LTRGAGRPREHSPAAHTAIPPHPCRPGTMPAYLTVPDDLISLFTPLPGLTPEERGLLAEALGEATADHAPP
jgi:hypothetical protein